LAKGLFHPGKALNCFLEIVRKPQRGWHPTC
jgi:hypothetical protein